MPNYCMDCGVKATNHAKRCFGCGKEERRRLAKLGWNTPPSQKGKIPKSYKGESVGYGALHAWVSYHLGKPKKCVACKTDGLIGHKIHWANKSGDYKRDLSDWVRLCVPCHSRYDDISTKMQNSWRARQLR